MSQFEGLCLATLAGETEVFASITKRQACYRMAKVARNLPQRQPPDEHQKSVGPMFTSEAVYPGLMLSRARPGLTISDALTHNHRLQQGLGHPTWQQEPGRARHTQKKKEV